MRAWSAWAPGLETREQWLAWSREPRLTARDGAPAVRFVPALQRRRLSQLAKMTLQMVQELAGTQHAGFVVASRHGEVHSCISMLSEIAREQPLSPTVFSHSVHNAPAGLLSITTGNCAPSSSIAAGRETLIHGLIEALALSQRRAAPVVLVCADEALPAQLEQFADEGSCSYAFGAVVSAAHDDGEIKLRLEFGSRAVEPVANSELPQALRLIAWLAAVARTIDFSESAERVWSISRVE